MSVILSLKSKNHSQCGEWPGDLRPPLITGAHIHPEMLGGVAHTVIFLSYFILAVFIHLSLSELTASRTSLDWSLMHIFGVCMPQFEKHLCI